MEGVAMKLPSFKSLAPNAISVASSVSIRRSFSCIRCSSSISVYSDASSEPVSLGHRARKDFRILHQEVNGSKLVYLDSAATSQKPAAVLEALQNYYEFYNSNVHRGIHYLSAKATDEFELARKKVARFINASDSREIVFTRNATEAINLVAYSWGLSNLKTGDEVILTVAEHHSCIVPWQIVSQKTGAVLKFVTLNEDETPDIDMLREMISGKTKLVAVHHVSNVLASSLPIEEIVVWVHVVGAKVLVDACQSVPHMVVDVQKLNADFLVASSYKLSTSFSSVVPSMAVPLSTSSNPLISRQYHRLYVPSTSFKGNVSVLGANPCQILSLKLHYKRRTGKQQQIARPLVVLNQTAATSPSSETVGSERFRLDNLGPQPGSRKRAKRKGRGISAGQGASCGFGMRGQKSRSGPGIMRGFEGGQTALYRRLPKLRGIAGGMRSGLPKYVPVNLKDIETAGFEDGDEVSLETLKQKGLINPSGRERKLPLKILGTGELSVKLTFKARAFSTSAKEKLEASGCTLTVLPGRKKWVKPSVAKNLARADEYFAKKRAAAAEAASEPAASA